MHFLTRAVAAALVAAGVAGCNRAPVRVPGPTLTLDMPAPPARVPIPVYLPEPDVILVEPVAELPPPPPAARPREGGPSRASDRPATASAPTAPPAAPPVLQTTTDISALEQKTLALLAVAQRDLDLVNYRSLSADARAQYDSAQGFVKMAKSALSIKNYGYAEILANKAAAVARLLVKS